MVKLSRIIRKVGNLLVPDPLVSDQQCARFYHADIEELEDTELVDELACLRVLLWKLPPDHWLRERVRVLEIELRKRQGKPWHK